MTAVAWSAEDLWVRFRGNSSPTLAGLSLEVPAGSHVQVLGRSGSGKSALAAATADLLGKGTPAEVRGERTWELVGRPLSASEVRDSVGVVFSHPWSQLSGVAESCAEEVAFGLECRALSRETIKTRVSNALERTGLLAFATRHPRTLSGGETQKLILAAFLALEPGLLVLDDVGAQLDLSGIRALRDAIESVRSELTLLSLTGDSAGLLSHPTALSALADGAITSFRSWDELFSGHARWSRCATPPLDLLVKEVAAGRYGLAEETKNLSRECERNLAPFADWISPRLERAQGPLLEVDRLVAHQGRDSLVLREVSLEVPRGRVLALLGPNGAGKTTLARCLLGLHPKDSGDIRVAGRDISGLRPDQVAHDVGLVFQNPDEQLLESSVVKEIRRSARLFHEPAAAQEIANVLIRAFDLEKIEEANPFDITFQQRRLTALGSCLARLPSLLVLDEPTAGMDWEGRYLVGAVARLFAKTGRAVLLITHDTDFAAEFGDDCAILSGGRILASGPVREVLLDSHTVEGFGVRPPLIKQAFERYFPTVRTSHSRPLTLSDLLKVDRGAANNH